MRVLPRPFAGRDPEAPEARARSREKAEAEYAWDWSWPPGCATLRDLPRRDWYPPDYIPHAVKVAIELTRNHDRMALKGARESGPPHIPSSSEDLVKRLLGTAEDLHAGAPRVRPGTEGEYANYFATFPMSHLAARQQKDPSAADALFAWQRVAGTNPMSLRRGTTLFEGFSLPPERWDAALRHAGAEPVTLDASLAAGRVYEIDFTFLHGAPATRYLGRQKYITGARALFLASRGELLPVAIQLEPGGTVFIPADGVPWKMARYCLQVADANVHETMSHLGCTHMVMEAVGIAGRRQLGDEHPLRKLLEPHIAGTFAVNHSAKTSLIAPNGVIDHVFAARIDVAAALVRTALDGFVLQDRAPTKELRARGLDDADLTFPYREDVVPVYAAIERFVASYVRLYYADDAAVSHDGELRAWVDEVGSPIGGALKGIRPVETFAGLVEWMTNILHVASAQHAAVNFPQFPYYSWGVNTAGACWGPPPRGEVTEADLLALMPPWDCMGLQADAVYLLSNIYYGNLGGYRPFDDLRVTPLVADFQRDLAHVEGEIALRDEGRLLPYPFLRPSLIPSSINI